MPEHTSLDDLGLIKDTDPKGMFKLIYDFPEQCETALDIGKQFSPIKSPPEFDHVLFTGMGGSAIAGNMISNLLSQDTKIVFATSRDYRIPNWVGPKTLVLCASYSGETEETRACYEEAKKRGAYIVCVASGGTLSKWATNDGNAVISIPGGQAPRSATGYMFVPMLLALGALGITRDWSDDIQKAISSLKELRNEIEPNIEESRNTAKQLARYSYKKIPIIYGESGVPFSVAYRWKCQINENAKQHAFCDEFPEMNHNEIEGWDGAIEHSICLGSADDVYAVYFIRSQTEHERNAARLKFHSETLLSSLKPRDVWLCGDNDLEKLLTGFYLGDYLSAYLAILNKVDPTSIDYINKLKNYMGSVEWEQPLRT